MKESFLLDFWDYHLLCELQQALEPLGDLSVAINEMGIMARVWLF